MQPKRFAFQQFRHALQPFEFGALASSCHCYERSNFFKDGSSTYSVIQPLPKYLWFAAVILCFALSGGTSAASQTSGISRGLVVDQQGNPVADVELSQFWLGGTADQGGFRNYGAVKSNRFGKFTLQIDRTRLPATVFAMDSERRRGALLIIDRVNSENNPRLVLQSLHQVQYRFEGTGLENLSQTRILLSPSPGPMFSQITGANRGALRLPPGRYVFKIVSADAGEKQVNFEVFDQDSVLDPITISSGIAEYYGKQAPSLIITEPVNSTSFSLESLRGKWTLVYFWAYWCAPCVQEGIPKLVAFCAENRDSQDRFVVLGVHENGVPEMITVEDLRQKIASLRNEKWGGKSLPFTILLDQTGETVKAWGISGYPTTAIIDPDGRLVRGDLDTVRQMLNRKPR